MPEIICGPYADPLRQAIMKIGGGRGLADSINLVLLTVKLGPMKGEFATGLQGSIPPRKWLDIFDRDNRRVVRRFHSGERWTIRWDYDPEKGPHVNLSIGSGDAMRWAFLSNRGYMSASMLEDKFQDIVRDQSRAIGFHRNDSQTEKGRRAKEMVTYWVNRYFSPPPNWTAQIRR